MSHCVKCKKQVIKTYDCKHTDFQEFCKDCYTELHYDLTEKNSLE